MTFLVVKQSHVRVTSKKKKIVYCSPYYLFPYFRCFFSWSSPPPSLFDWPRALLSLTIPNHIYVLRWHIIHCLIYFGFIECLYMVGRYSEGIPEFCKKIHAMPFVFNFSREILCSIFEIFCSIVRFLMLPNSLFENSSKVLSWETVKFRGRI